MRRGQIITLDFLLSIIVVTVAIGLIIQSAEINSYDLKERQIYDDLKRIGNPAVYLLAASPEVACELIGSAGETIGSLINCVPNRTNSNFEVTKANLGVPAQYKCRVELSGYLEFATECNDVLGSGTKMVYSTSRNVVAYNSGASSFPQRLPKSVLEECISSGCSELAETKIIIQVWK